MQQTDLATRQSEELQKAQELMFGLSKPVPNVMRTSPPKNAASEGSASVKWPSAIMSPPQNTDRRPPRKLSATNPPGMQSM